MGLLAHLLDRISSNNEIKIDQVLLHVFSFTSSTGAALEGLWSARPAGGS